MEVAKLVTQPFCASVSKIWTKNLQGAACFRLQRTRGISNARETYVALEGSLEDQLFSH